MRLGRAAFWRFLFFNAIAAAVLAGLLPQAARFAPVPYHDMLLAVPPMLAAFFLCLPAGWMGVRRLHDTGHSGWQAWLPLVPLAGMGAMPAGVAMLQQHMLAMLFAGQGDSINRIIGRFAIAGIISLWLGALVVAAGIVRTFFLWMEPGEAGENRYGPPPPENIVSTAPARAWLKGRISRIVFWPVVLANFAFVSGATYVFEHWSGLPVAAAHTLSNQVDPWLYLPAFIAAALRLHDRNRPGALALIVFLINAAAPFAEAFLNGSEISLMNVAIDFFTFYLLFQCWQPGDADANRYGPPPGAQPAPMRLPATPRGVSPSIAMPRATQASAMPASSRPASRTFGRRA